jgi:uncharacterized protein
MDQRLTFLTIAVKDLEQMKRFYRDCFGWAPMRESEGIVFFKLNGIILGLYPEVDLSEDIDIEFHNISKGNPQFTLAINFSSRQQVDEAIKSLRSKGVRIVREAEDVFWGGYRGYIADPENNYWELAWNPYLEMDDEGNVIRHK